jgi:hypothetical protein
MSASDKFNSLVSELGEDAMIALCSTFLTQFSPICKKPVKYENLTADNSLDPVNCPLHRELMTGRILLQNSEGGYPVDAPPCHGCSIGLTDAIKSS